MKRLTALVIIISLCFIQMPVFGQDMPQKGANQKTLENANDQAVFNRVTDWFATRGKSPEEKEKILAERKAKRAAKRAQKEAKMAGKKAEKGMKQNKEKMRKAKEDMKKGFKS